MKPVSADLLGRLRSLAAWHIKSAEQWEAMTDNELSSIGKDHRDKSKDVQDILAILEDKK